MAAKDDLGVAGECAAVQYVEALGWRVLDRNWRGQGGELDVVALEGSWLVAVEVKTRRTDRFGDPLNAVDAVKLSRLWRLILQWRREHPDAHRLRVRVDVVGITGDDPSCGEIAHLRDVK